MTSTHGARRARHSYREDAGVPAFDDATPIIVFDGMCVLCSAGVQWMLARDPEGSARFMTIQAPLAQALYRHYELDADAFDTFMVLTDGQAHVKWRGVLAAGRALPGLWRLLAVAAGAIPPFLGDPAYDFIQRNRIRWFGSRKSCLVPDARLAARFV